MRWVGFIFAAAVAVMVQVTVGAIVRIRLGSSGLTLAVDFMAILAVLIGLRSRRPADAVLAGWVLGMLIDLASADSPLGLWALAYALATGMVVQVRSAVFSENPLTQAALGFSFCVLAHGAARTFAHVYVHPGAGALGRDWLQILLLASCTAAATPLIMRLMRGLAGVMLVPPRRQRRV